MALFHPTEGPCRPCAAEQTLVLFVPSLCSAGLYVDCASVMARKVSIFLCTLNSASSNIKTRHTRDETGIRLEFAKPPEKDVDRYTVFEMCVIYQKTGSCGDSLPQEMVRCYENLRRQNCIETRSVYIDDACQRCFWLAYLRLFLLTLIVLLGMEWVVFYFERVWPVVLILVALVVSFDKTDAF
jgi:hypothetical protein